MVRLLVETGVIHHIGDSAPLEAHTWTGRMRTTTPSFVHMEELTKPQAPNRDNSVGQVMRDYFNAYFKSEVHM